jgi:hypothetical protein
MKIAIITQTHTDLATMTQLAQVIQPAHALVEEADKIAAIIAATTAARATMMAAAQVIAIIAATDIRVQAL